MKRARVFKLRMSNRWSVWVFKNSWFDHQAIAPTWNAAMAYANDEVRKP